MILLALSQDQFAAHLGFGSWTDLIRASTRLEDQGQGMNHFVTPMSDGRYAAWDDLELSDANVRFFPSHNDAMEYNITLAAVGYSSFHGRDTGDITATRQYDLGGRITSVRLELGQPAR